MRNTAKQMGLDITPGTLPKCESSAIGKIHQKAVPKEADHHTTSPGELMYIDISSVKTSTSCGGYKHWVVLFLDDKTDMCITKFARNKSDLHNIGLNAI